ncbi:radical SAM protein [Desulfosarcina alkanivorans]|uniref:Radical SAM protein n=1 Tax=Desulfosarcina alkanivorans TaxID=571177 RepID=A0A5K7YJY8_9BACT|nr:radical SAM protein [Desulfosarcina alkanivorans]BBO69992.1 radical SAM protein [Desulfosarcina alkanivorans]
MTPRGDTTPAGRPLIIPLFIPHMGCPHQCIFCNQQSITGKSVQTPSRDQIHREVNRFLKYGKKRPSTTQISFFGGSFLGLGKTTILSLLEAAIPFVQEADVDSIRFSTRPDTVTPEMLDLLNGFPVSTVELGVQSMNDPVLDAAGRGHRAADTVAATALLKKRGYQVGLQMMVGLPEDDDDGAMETACRIAALQPDFVRIYPTLVLKGSPLASRFLSGRYHPMGLAACVTLVKRLYLFFKTHHIPVVRMGLQASDGLTRAGDFIAGPYHPAFGHLVHGEIVLDAISSALGRMENPPDPLTITVHPTMVSRVQGLNKNNLRHLKHAFDLKKIALLQNANQDQNHLMVADRQVTLP